MKQEQNSFVPAYLKLSRQEMAARLEKLKEMLKSCVFCPRQCRVNRLEGEIGLCQAPAKAAVSSAFAHFGEERELVGRGGSGTIFFIHCNLECLFCQNFTISRALEKGEELTGDELASVMLSLQKRGVSNINFVTPTPYLYQICQAISLASKRGLRLPVVYNCGGYESVEALKLLEGFIDIYMPDAKYSADSVGEKYSGVKDYYTRLKEALPEMQRQVGDLKIDSDGLARRGLLVRHLVLPEKAAGSAEMARFLSEEVSANCAVNVMAQYRPAYRANEFAALSRRLTRDEYLEAKAHFKKKGLRLL